MDFLFKILLWVLLLFFAAVVRVVISTLDTGWF